MLLKWNNKINFTHRLLGYIFFCSVFICNSQITRAFRSYAPVNISLIMCLLFYTIFHVVTLYDLCVCKFKYVHFMSTLGIKFGAFQGDDVEDSGRLTSRWAWRYPRYPDWPAKETLLPARHPPQMKPWWRCLLSLHPHHLTRTKLLSTQLDHTDTSCISFSNHLTSLPLLSWGSRCLQHPTHQLTPRYRNRTPKIHWKMATSGDREPTELASSP